MKKIQIDLRGTIFVSRSLALQNTLERLTAKNLAEIISDGNYYLDRNPLIFHHILDYYSEGHFHLPRNICPIQARSEVEFWGIPLTDVPPCCYETLYDDNESELKAISALEEEINEVEEKYNQMKRQHDTPGSFSWIAIQYKLVNALNFPLQSLLGRVWLLVVALCTAISITVFLLESSAVFRVERNGQINNITIEMFGDNPKAFKIATTGMSPEMAVVELLSNTILTFDLILRFSISHQKKRFCRKPLNIIEFMIEILIFSFVSLEFLLDHEEAAKHTSYELSTLLQILYSLRVFRIFRLIESCSETKMLKISLLKSKTEFLLFVTVLISFAFIFGSWIFWAELLNPQTFPTIFTGIWWAIVTMTTVGYGDFTPKSTLGYFVGVLTSIFGLILLAMPIATIASNFSKIYDCYNFRKSHLKAKRAKQSNQLFYHRKAAMVL